MNTEFALLALFGKPYVRLEEVCQDYFNVGAHKAKQMASRGEFPVPVMRASHSQKSPYLVKVTDLARHLDDRYNEHREDWEKVRS